MTREDLVRYLRRRQRPRIYLIAVIGLLYFLVFALSMSGHLVKIFPGWSQDRWFPTLTAVVMGVVTVIGLTNYIAPPKCPHCGVRFSAWLLHIAIASGNCGFCGKSIEEAPLNDG
ncbi:MAG TPA: hypothetical protein VGS57_13465 [Thermoanaerobaculia bacterium]|jgi:hypothetical protein|nr:hypothetical protein [Thermoanaerobaculia bacterium]